MLREKGPHAMRRGRTYRVRVLIQGVRGGRAWRTVRVRPPRGMPAGERLLTLVGPDTDESGIIEIDLGELLFGDEEGPSGAPRTVGQLRAAIGAIGRYDGVSASFEPPEGDDDLGDLGDDDPGGAEGIARRARRVYRDPDLRLSGVVRLRVLVR